MIIAGISLLFTAIPAEIHYKAPLITESIALAYVKPLEVDVYDPPEVPQAPIVEVPEKNVYPKRDSKCKSYLEEDCSCMIYLQVEKGLPIYGDAISVEPNYFGTAERGDVIIFRYSNGEAHTAFNEETYNGVYFISEDNFYAGEHSTRIIDIDNPDIYGVWRNFNKPDLENQAN